MIGYKKTDFLLSPTLIDDDQPVITMGFLLALK
jgi:hypothetical protein